MGVYSVRTVYYSGSLLIRKPRSPSDHVWINLFPSCMASYDSYGEVFFPICQKMWDILPKVWLFMDAQKRTGSRKLTFLVSLTCLHNSFWKELLALI